VVYRMIKIKAHSISIDSIVVTEMHLASCSVVHLHTLRKELQFPNQIFIPKLQKMNLKKLYQSSISCSSLICSLSFTFSD
jgi:hypothetical protein